MSLFPFDQTGLRIDNRIVDEGHTVNEINGTDVNYIVPRNAPYFRESLVVVDTDTNRILEPGIDYTYSHHFSDADDALARKVYGSFAFIDPNYTGNIKISYQTLGGDFVTAFTQAIQGGLAALVDLTTVDWEDIAGVQPTFPPTAHTHPVTGIDGVSQFIDVMHQIKEAIADPYKTFRLADAEDVKEEWIDPLLSGIQGIKAAILARGWGDNLPFEALQTAVDNNGEFNLGSKIKNNWFTILEFDVPQAGTYIVNWHLPQQPFDETNAVLQTRITVDGGVINESYGKGMPMSFPEGAKVRLEAQVLNNNVNAFYVSRYNERSTLTAVRIGF